VRPPDELYPRYHQDRCREREACDPDVRLMVRHIVGVAPRRGDRDPMHGATAGSSRGAADARSHRLMRGYPISNGDLKCRQHQNVLWRPERRR
jgi:hypothetical protein